MFGKGYGRDFKWSLMPPNRADLHIITLPSGSAVGEQPYNEAGSLAYPRELRQTLPTSYLGQQRWSLHSWTLLNPVNFSKCERLIGWSPRCFSFDRDLKFGRVIVGQILAVHVSGLDKKDWQVALGGRSRYELPKKPLSSSKYRGVSSSICLLAEKISKCGKNEHDWYSVYGRIEHLNT